MAQPANTVVVVEKGEDPAAAASAESCAKIMFILGLFLPLLGLYVDNKRPVLRERGGWRGEVLWARSFSAFRILPSHAYTRGQRGVGGKGRMQTHRPHALVII